MVTEEEETGGEGKQCRVKNVRQYVRRNRRKGNEEKYGGAQVEGKRVRREQRVGAVFQVLPLMEGDELK